MNLAKKEAFSRKFGKKRLKLRKGGVIPHFDSGGTILGGPGNPTNTNTTGIGGIAQGLGLNAASANIQPGTNAAQLNNAYSGTQNAINNQNNLTSTLAPQAATAVGNQNTLAQQEAAMAAGQGPNPAQAQLAQATGANVANEAALMAGQRGASANPALMAREAAQQGAATQQSAAGQAATLEANQQINAQNNLANLSANQIGQTGAAVTAQNTAEQNEQNTLENANTSANNAAVQMQSNINNENAQNNKGILGGITSGLGAVAGLLNEGGEVKANPHGKAKLEFIHKMTKMGMEHYDSGGSVSSPNSPSSMGVPSGVLGAMNISKHADGGTIQPVQSTFGGQYNQSQASGGPNIESTPSSDMDLAKNAKEGFKAGQDFKNRGVAAANAALPANTTTFNNDLSAGPAQTQNASQGFSDYFQNAAHGGEIHIATHFTNYFNGGEAKKVAAMVSPGELYLSPDQVKQVIHEGVDPKDIGHTFKGKAKVKGDSLKNDNIPVDLEEGGVIIDRKNMDKRHKRELFVHRAIAKHKAGGKL